MADDFGGGLLQFLNTPAGQGLLSGVASYAANARRGQPLNSMGAGVLGGLAGYAGAQDRQTAQAYRKLQMDSLTETVAAAKRKEGILSQVLGGLGGAGAAPMDASSAALQDGASAGSIGPTVANADRLKTRAPAPSAGGFVGNLSPDKIAALKLGAGVDLTDVYKLTQPNWMNVGGNMVNTNDPSFKGGFVPQLQMSQNGQATFAAPGPDGVPVVSMPKGALETFTRYQVAQQAPQALLSAAGKVNLRDNPDGTKTPVSELSENPTLQNLIGSLTGVTIPGSTAAPPQALIQAPIAPAARAPAASPVPMRVAPADQRTRDAEAIRILQSELKNPNLPQDQREGIARELNRFTASQSTPGFPTPTVAAPTGAPRYGKTTAQETSERTSATFGDAMARQQAETLDKSYSSANAAADDLKTIGQARQAIASGVYAGSGAEFKLGVAKFINANVPGLTVDPQKVANTDYLKSTLGRGLLDQAKTLGSNPSNADAQRINDIVGSIGKDPEAMQKILSWREEMARRAIQLHNGKVDQAEKRGYSAPYDMRVQAPEPTTSKSSSVVQTLPKSAAKGARARDLSSGGVLVFNGLSWVPEKK